MRDRATVISGSCRLRKAMRGQDLHAVLSLLSILGLGCPFRILPVLFWEFTGKAFWLLAVALPHWFRAMEPGSRCDTFAIGMMAAFVPLVPWSHVLEHYVRKSGDRSRGRTLVSPDEASRKRRRWSGGILTGAFLVLIITGYLLYYIGDDSVRPCDFDCFLLPALSETP